MKDLYQQIAIAFGAVILSMIAFYMIELRYYVSRDEVTRMIQVESPYVIDRIHIKTELAHMEYTKKNLYNLLREQTDILNQLKAEIVRLTAVLDIMQRRDK